MSLLEVEKDDKTLRILTNFWTLIALFIFTLDFLEKGKISSIASGIGILYLLILGYYTGTKEFCRWQDYHDKKRHIGELFVGVWTILIAVLVVTSVIYPGYQISGGLIALYTTVVGIFALTQHSKTLYKESHSNKRR
jgi:hypothetical protein